MTFFSEDRLGRSERGRITSIDANLADGGWARGLTSLENAAFAARVSDHAGGIAVAQPVRGEVVPLPYYVGARDMVARLPGLFLAVLRAVNRSSAIAVRLPGVIGTLAVVSATLLRRPIAVELVGDIGDVLRSGVGGRLGTVAAGPSVAVTRWAVRRATWVRYVTARTLQARYPASVAATFAFSDVILTEADFVDRPKQFGGAPVVIAIGSHEQRYKGHDTLIRAIAVLSDEIPHLQCTILGEGRFQAELRDLARGLSVAGQIVFRGHVSARDAVRSELDRSWILAMPSRTEGLPRAMVEAMARGLPCVGTSVGGVPELLEDEWLVSPDDVTALAGAIRRLCADAQVRGAQSRRNRAHAAELNRRNATERARWLSLIESLAIRGAKK